MNFPESKPHDFDKLYYECRAAITLKLLFSKEYDGYKKDERPDFIYPNKTGLEVTRASAPEDRVQLDYYQKNMKGKRLSQIPPKSLTRFVKSGRDVLCSKGLNNTPEDQIWGYAEDCDPHPDLLCEAIRKKHNAINGEAYAPGYTLSLYVFSSVICEYETIESLSFLTQFMDSIKGVGRQFDKVFIDTGCDVFVYSTTSQSIKMYNIEPLLKQIKDQAITLALKLS